MTDLAKLLEELQTKAATLAKAQPAPEVVAAVVAVKEAAPAGTAVAAAADAAVAAVDTQATEAKAAEQAAADVAGAEKVVAKAAGGEGADTDEGEEVAKSIQLFDADGNPVEAVDGFALLKSMQDAVEDLNGRLAVMETAALAREDALAKSFTDGATASTAQTETLAKALGDALEAVEQGRVAHAAQAAGLEAQASRIIATEAVVKSLTAVVEKMGAEGAGRRSVVSIQERPSVLAKAEPSVTIGDIMAKASVLVAAGKLDAIGAGKVTSCANSGQGIPPEFAALFAAV